MSKRKIWSDFNRLECGKTEKIFAGTGSFNKRVEISSSVERMVLQGGSKLEENETNDADNSKVQIITAFCSILCFFFWPQKFSSVMTVIEII